MPRFCCLLVILLAGCRPTPTDVAAASSPPAVEAGTAFDAAATGTLRGRITWEGNLVTVPPLESVLSEKLGNPFTPKIDPASRGLAGAVVYLKNFDPAIGRAWDLPAARVNISEEAIRIVQGDETRAVGFVRRGTEVSLASTEKGHRMLRARGASYFTLAFPEPDQPLTRRFDQPGVVSFTSGSGEFWAAADLFVSDHPYFAVTGADGSFTLPQVPAGDRELGIRVRDWHTIGKDRDPETGIVIRVQFADPVEKTARVRVEAGRTAEVTTSFRGTDFANP